MISPTLEELCDQYRDTAEAKPASADPTSAGAPILVEPVLSKESALEGGPPGAAEEGAGDPSVGEGGAKWRFRLPKYPEFCNRLCMFFFEM